MLMALIGCGGGSQPELVFDPTAVWGLNLAVGGGRVYTTTTGESCGSLDASDHAVWSFPNGGDAAELVFCGGSGQFFGSGMATDGDRVLWPTHGSGGVEAAIYAAPIAGGDRELFATMPDGAKGIATDGEFVYAATSTEIVRVPLAGGPPTVMFAPDGGGITWFDVVGDTLVATVLANSGSEVVTLGLDGSSPTTLATLVDSAIGQFCFDAVTIFVITAGTDVVQVPRDGSPTTLVATGLEGARGCAVQGGIVYTSLGGLDTRTTKQIVRLGPERTVIGEVEAVFIGMIAIQDDVLHYAGSGGFGRIAL